MFGARALEPQECKKRSEENEHEYKSVYTEVIYLNHYPEQPYPLPEKWEAGFSIPEIPRYKIDNMETTEAIEWYKLL